VEPKHSELDQPWVKEARAKVDLRLKKRFGERPVRDRELLSYLVSHDLVESMDPDDVDNLVNLIHRQRDAQREHHRQAARAETRASSAPNPRYEALAQIIAIETARDERVVHWRENYLPGGLIPFNEIDRAIDALIQGEDLSTDDQTLAVRYLSPNGFMPDGSSRVVVRADGIVGYLGWLAKQLSRENQWASPEAVTFVLCGRVPPYHPITIRRSETPRPATTRIILEIEPRTPKEQVAQAYENARNSLELAARDRDSARPVSQKTAELAAFWAEHPEEPTDLRLRWNKEFRRWAYPDGRSFGRDLRRAWEAIVGTNHSGPTERTWLKEAWPYGDPPPRRPPRIDRRR
jgi:hypothetical protein